jgi:hypothetical protein
MRIELAFDDRNFQYALSMADKAVIAVPAVAETHRCKSFALMAMGTFREAVLSEMQALELEPHYSENRYMLALAFAEFQRSDLAPELCSTLRWLGMRSWRLSMVLGIASWCGEQPITAVNHIDYACSQNPKLRPLIRSFHSDYEDYGKRTPPEEVPIPILKGDVESVRVMSVLQMVDTGLESTHLAFDGPFPEKRSSTARDRVIVSLAGYHFPATNMDELNFMFNGKMVGPIKCSQCVTRLPVIHEGDLICYDCGLMLNGGIDECLACKGRDLQLLINAWH